MSPSSDSIPRNVTGIHRKILRRLWSKEWVPSKDLLALTGQAEYARRLRELRREWGYSIENKIIKGEHHYRLSRRRPKSAERRRKYFAPKQRSEIILRTGIRCNLCKFEPPKGQIEGWLMWDHRTPFDRGGDTISANGQLLCVSCNNLKRRTCGECVKEDCGQCLLSNPELAAGTCILAFDKDTWIRLKKRAESEDLAVPEFAGRLVKRHVDES